MIKLLKQLSVIILMFSTLSGCFKNPMVSNQDFTFSEGNKANGLLAFSSQCYSYGEPLELDLIRKMDKGLSGFGKAFLSQNIAPVDINCSSKLPYYSLLKLEQGEYIIVDIAPRGEMSLNTQTFKFHVYPNKITYIGRLLAEVNANTSSRSCSSNCSLGTLDFAFIDKASKDIPVLLDKYYNLKNKQFIKTLPQVNKRPKRAKR